MLSKQNVVYVHPLASRHYDEGTGGGGRVHRRCGGALYLPSKLSTTAAARAMTLGFVLTALCQLSAGPIIQYFPKHLLELAGHSGDTATILSVWIAFAKMLATGVVAYALDTVGRRFFLVLGITVQLIASVVLGAMFGDRGWDEYDALDGLQRRLVDISLFLCLAGFQLGFGPLTWAVIGGAAHIECMHRRRFSSTYAFSFFFPATLLVSQNVTRKRRVVHDLFWFL